MSERIALRPLVDVTRSAALEAKWRNHVFNTYGVHTKIHLFLQIILKLNYLNDVIAHKSTQSTPPPPPPTPPNPPPAKADDPHP
jgi:hypothetical protein